MGYFGLFVEYMLVFEIHKVILKFYFYIRFVFVFVFIFVLFCFRIIFYIVFLIILCLEILG
jgi:hypothetical protein